MTTWKRIPLRDRVGLLLLIALGIAAIIGAQKYGFEDKNGLVGAGFLPTVAGGVMVIAALIVLIKNIVIAARGGSFEVEEIDPDDLLDSEGVEKKEEEAEEDNGLDVFGRSAEQRGRAVFFIFLIIFAALLLLKFVGLLIALTLMVFCLVMFVEKRGLVPSLLASLGAFAFGFIVFKTLLEVRLPEGMLGLV